MTTIYCFGTLFTHSGSLTDIYPFGELIVPSSPPPPVVSRIYVFAIDL